jgi:hypothetical protein
MLYLGHYTVQGTIHIQQFAHYEQTSKCIGWKLLHCVADGLHDRVVYLTSVVLSVPKLFVDYHFCVLFTLYVYATCLKHI